MLFKNQLQKQAQFNPPMGIGLKSLTAAKCQLLPKGNAYKKQKRKKNHYIYSIVAFF